MVNLKSLALSKRLKEENCSKFMQIEYCVTIVGDYNVISRLTSARMRYRDSETPTTPLRLQMPNKSLL